MSNTMPRPIKKNSTTNDRTVPALLSASFEIYDMTTDSTKLTAMIVTTQRTLTTDGFCGGFFFCLFSVDSKTIRLLSSFFKPVTYGKRLRSPVFTQESDAGNR